MEAHPAEAPGFLCEVDVFVFLVLISDSMKCSFFSLHFCCTQPTEMDWPPERIINNSNVVHDEEIWLALEDPKVIMQLSEHSDLQWSPNETKHSRVNRRAFTLHKLNAIKVDGILEPLEGQKNDDPVKRSCLVLDVPIRASRDKKGLQPGQGQSEVLIDSRTSRDFVSRRTATRPMQVQVAVIRTRTRCNREHLKWVYEELKAV